jgi:hypothetical protein
MKYLKIFDSYKSFQNLTQDQYEDLIWHRMPFSNDEVRNDIYTLNYKEQEDIITFFKSKYNVTESLDGNKFIDNEVVIGFNKVGKEVSCWVNLRFVKTYPKTKKWVNGRRKILDEVEITITKVEDEWFFVRSIGTKFNDYVKCDQIYGVLEYLKSRF